MQPISFIVTIAAMEFAGRISKITQKFSASPSRVDLTTKKKTCGKTASVYCSENEVAAPHRSSQPTSLPSLQISFKVAPKIDLVVEVPSLRANHNRITLNAWGFVPLSPIVEVCESKPSFESIVTPATPIDELNPYFPENDNFGHFVVDEEGNWHWAAVDMKHLSPQWKASKLDVGFQFAQEENQAIQWPTFEGGDDQENSDEEDDELSIITLHELLISEHIQNRGVGMFNYC